MQFSKLPELTIALNKWVFSIEKFFISFGEILFELYINSYLNLKTANK